MFDTQTEVLPGTKVEEVSKYDENPVEEPAHQVLFHDGYWHITVSSDGHNPFFTEGRWGILLVSPVDETLDFNFTDKTFAIAFVEQDARVVTIRTKTEVVQHADIDWQIGTIIISVQSKTKGEELIKVYCGVPEPIEKPILKQMN